MSQQQKYGPTNPVTEYYRGQFPIQEQPYPGLQAKMNPRPDSGEKTYVGTGRLKGRKALITGGDSGIGRAVAIAYAREGADVMITCLPSEQDDAQEVLSLLHKEGVKSGLVLGDLSTEGYCRGLVRESLEHLGGLDILVLNAGHQVATNSIEEISSEQLHSVFAINLFSMFWVVQEALPHLPSGASIITTSSIQAYQPSPNLPDYAASKAAVRAFTQSLAIQLAPRGIRVNSVAPGPVWTPLQVSGGQLQQDIPDFGLDTPLGRAGQPVEMAGAYVFLASNESSFLSGEIIGATGGKTLGG